MNTENLNRKIVSGCESLAGKALTIDHDARTYHIGDRVIPFSSCVIKGVADFTSNTIICTSFDNCNRNIKTVGLVTIDDRVFIKITLNSEFPMYEGYESLRSEVY
nr:MAG TPA: hypothetical protein [Crassvirales sp.]